MMKIKCEQCNLTLFACSMCYKRLSQCSCGDIENGFSDNGTSPTNKEEGITNCPCGCEQVILAECAQCRQPAMACSNCYRRLSPCACDMRVSSTSQNLESMESVKCPCGCESGDRFYEMEQVIGCSECLQRVSPCGCEEKQMLERNRRREGIARKDDVAMVRQEIRNTADARPFSAQRYPTQRCEDERKQIESLKQQLQDSEQTVAELSKMLSQCSDSRQRAKKLSKRKQRELLDTDTIMIASSETPREYVEERKCEQKRALKRLQNSLQQKMLKTMVQKSKPTYFDADAAFTRPDTLNVLDSISMDINEITTILGDLKRKKLVAMRG